MKRTHLPLNGLRVFDAAARHLSFTRAADELAVTPAAVGQHIRALEDLLGVVLFRRTTRGLELTAEAEAALPSLRLGFSHFEQSVALLQVGQASTVVTIAAPASFAARWLAPRLAAYRAQNEGLSLRLFASTGPIDFTQANIDLAILHAPQAPDGQPSHLLQGDALAAVAAPDVRAPLIHDADNDWAAWLARAGVPDARPGDGLHVDLSAAAIEAALAGQGVALASVPLVADLLARGLLVEPLGPAQADPRCYWLSAPEPQWQQKKVRALVAWLMGLQ